MAQCIVREKIEVPISQKKEAITPGYCLYDLSRRGGGERSCNTMAECKEHPLDQKKMIGRVKLSELFGCFQFV